MGEINYINVKMRMDKTAFKKQSLSNASDHQTYYNNFNHADQAKIFHSLMAAAYGFVSSDYPRMEKKLTAKSKIANRFKDLVDIEVFQRNKD